MNIPKSFRDRQKMLAEKANYTGGVEATVRRVEDTRRQRYELQESKRAPKIQVDQKIILWSWLIGIGFAFISSAIVSFNGITAVAQFVGLSQAWMAGLFFFFIELMYLLFLVAYLVLASRMREDGKPEKTFGAILGMVAFGGIAVLANAFHTFDFWEWNYLEPRMWAGTVLSVAAPIAIIAASKMASRVVFAKAIKL
jgi:vacuolar-type H+-ATPase subunit I/STV1